MGYINVCDRPNAHSINVSYSRTTVSDLYDKISSLLVLPVGEFTLEWDGALLHKDAVSLENRGIDTSDTVSVKRRTSS